MSRNSLEGANKGAAARRREEPGLVPPFRHWLAGLLLAVIAAFPAAAVPVVWAEDSLTTVLPGARPSSTSPEAIRLYAARGERESFQVCIHGTRNDRRVVAVTTPDHPVLGQPEVHRAGFVSLPEPSPRAVGSLDRWPDRLMPFEPFTVPQGETRSLWVSYFVPRSAPAGIHHTSIRVQLEPGRTYTIEVTVEVFDFTLPDPPSYRTLLAMDWRRLERFAPSDAESLADDTYRRLAPYRAGYNAHIDEPPPALGRARPLDAAALQRSLSRANALGQVAVLDLGAGQALSRRWERPQYAGEPDRLTPFLEQMSQWLGERGWTARAIVQPAPMAARHEWEDLRIEYRRVRAASRDTVRLVRAPFHPFFERLAEVWAVPYGAYNPAAHDRLLRGLSLDDGVDAPAARVTASSWAALPGAEDFPGDPRDGYDGSPFTAWFPSAPPRPGAPQWLEIIFDQPVSTQTFTIHWPAGFEGTDLTVRTSFDGRAFSTVSVDWRHERSALPFENTRSHGRFRISRQLRGIRIAIERPARGHTAAIANITFGTPRPDREPSLVVPPEVWFTPGGDFPSFAPDALPIEARLFPWLSWAWSVRGLADAPLNDWPSQLTLPAPEDAETFHWPTPVPPLLYPNAESGFEPSLRLERLRDGIEDYEYLVAARRIIDAGGPLAAEFEQALPAMAFFEDPDLDRTAELAAAALEARVRIGRLISRRGGAAIEEKTE